MDIVGPFPESEAGNIYILVVADYFMRWMEAFAIPNQEASTFANKLVDEVLCVLGSPPNCTQIRASSLSHTLWQRYANY